MKNPRIRHFLVAGCLLTSLFPAQAYNFQKDLSSYGYLSQLIIPSVSNYYCGPVSAVNSFVYLENKYPTIYDDLLVPGNNLVTSNLVNVALTLGGSGYMGTDLNGTTYADDFIWGKMTYIEQKATNKTIYAAQDKWSWGNPNPKPSWVTSNVYPTWSFLYNELVACEDVEMLLSWTNGGHYVTLSSFHWNDANTNNIIDSGEGFIDFIDPWGGLCRTNQIWQGTGGRIEVSYDGFTHAGGVAWISMAVAESVPEPSTCALIFTSGVILIYFRRHRT